MIIENHVMSIEIIDNSHCLNYYLKASKRIMHFDLPVFEINGEACKAILNNLRYVNEPIRLLNGCMEYDISGNFISNPMLSLNIKFWVAENNPIVRFKYTLNSETCCKLTKIEGKDALTYLSTSYANLEEVTEVRFSEFNDMIHSFCLSEVPVTSANFEHEMKVMGPMLVGSDQSHTFFIAYEHGSQIPDAFINFALNSNYEVNLQAVKGNYYNGYEVDATNPYECLWLQVGAVSGNLEDLSKEYRTFVLKYMTVNSESRKPYIFYNTWCFQERNKHWNGKKYLDSMNESRILEEIDVAHKMGLDVFVLDTGWYEKTGDWCVSSAKFKENLKNVKTKLDGYGMKLGLWFNPTVAALTSNMLHENMDNVMTWDGKANAPFPVWETEESKALCLVSEYHEAFVQELIRLVREVGVTYFKWDAVRQYGCDDSKHYHGNELNSLQERKDCYAFQLVVFMAKVIDKVCRVCPEAIIDFDITEGRRTVGLGFLSSGKYFLINNGPYYRNYDIAPEQSKPWTNIFVYPGPARAWVCRTPLNFDKWLPSVLFLTHYLPDDPKESQNINVASLILGQNGIWGDLLSISQEGVERIGGLLRLYKQVRDDITESYPVTFGQIGGSLEVHEKISALTGRGAVVLFSNREGQYTYVTAHNVSKNYWCNEGVTVTFDNHGRAKIDVKFEKADAKILYFGVEC